MRLVIGIALSLVVAWAAFVVFLLVTARGLHPHEAARLVPDTFGLVRRLASDRTIPRSARVPVWVLLAYLASPIDLIPDFVPVIGFADDAILTSLVLRHLLHRAGPEKLDQHWSGSAEGLAILRRSLRLPEAA